MYPVLYTLIGAFVIIALVGTIMIGFRPKDQKYTPKKSFMYLTIIYSITLLAMLGLFIYWLLF
ncbi:hypothetical protein G4V62_15690 [Bacillaceae bacterium SIJ1]|uniref:hypothetical protein n=1 Tax=Litoribacterium kuwaitense TaxID=1398745 RepID=UPI0013EC0F8B|nr:hypothetical protein [Litoribacterium kuwaitense]NGP46315.1 hypothetical protein [Litoribacterium kuwaitense]